MMLRAEFPVQRKSTLYRSRCAESSWGIRMRLVMSNPCSLRSADDMDVTTTPGVAAAESRFEDLAVSAALEIHTVRSVR